MKKTFLLLGLALSSLVSQAQVFLPDGGSSPACSTTYWWPCSYSYYPGFSANWSPNPATSLSYHINTSTASVADVEGEAGASKLHFEVGNFIPGAGVNPNVFYFKRNSKTGAVLVYKKLDLGIYCGLGANSIDKVYKTTYDQATKRLYMCGVTKANGSAVPRPFLLCFNTLTDNVVWMTLLPSTYVSSLADAEAKDLILYNGDIIVALTAVDPTGVTNVHQVIKCNAGGAVLASGSNSITSLPGSNYTPHLFANCMTIHSSSQTIILAGQLDFGGAGSISQFDLNTLSPITWTSSILAEDVDVDPLTDDIVLLGNTSAIMSAPGNHAYWSTYTPQLMGPMTWGFSSVVGLGKNLIISPIGDHIVTFSDGVHDYLTYIDKTANDIYYGPNAYQFPLNCYAQALHKDDNGDVIIGGVDLGIAGDGHGDDARVFTAKFNAQQPDWAQYQNRSVPSSVIAQTAVIPFAIFPNPATDLITISHATGQGVCEVRNVTGQLVLSATADKDDNHTQLRVTGLAPGMYQVSYKAEGAPVQTGKFVKQ
ncbi:MAG: T9SS type A sorting domain-containing protein [Sphingobacteriales bacterium]|nr:MAG: T9SS type A sorting domain-containing protein [Sphingobacteriales bacterium]